MNYKEQLSQDKNYQSIVERFKNGQDIILKSAKSGVISGALLTGSITKIFSDLENSVRDYQENKMKELEEKQQEIIQKYKQDVDYSTNEAKQLEVKFSLADKHELEDYVRELKGDNMLEINLLRMELRKRDLTNLDWEVKKHVITSEGEYRQDEEYNAITKQIATLRTMGTQAVIIDGEYTRIDTAQNELAKEVLEHVRNVRERKDKTQMFKDMQTYSRALESL